MLPGIIPVVEGPYIPNAVRFDGTNDYLNLASDLTGVSDGAEGTYSGFANFKGGNGSTHVFHSSADAATRFFIHKNTSNLIRIRGQNTGGGTVLEAFSATAYTDADEWLHILISWNQTTSDIWMYINDVDDLAASPTQVANNIDYTQGNWGVGANPGGANKLNADRADDYLNLATSFDLSVTANRRKFITPTLRPVDLGGDGSRPTGSSPASWLSGPTDTWHTNDGAGGGFTENGALTDGADGPGDL